MARDLHANESLALDAHMKQQALAIATDQTFENCRKPTRRGEFLKTMDAIVPGLFCAP